jgi:hypothetical protein
MIVEPKPFPSPKIGRKNVVEQEHGKKSKSLSINLLPLVPDAVSFGEKIPE